MVKREKMLISDNVFFMILFSKIGKIGKLGEKEDIVLPIDLRTGIITTDENPLRIDDITLAFLRKKANWKDKEVNHEVSLPPGARR